MPRDSFWQEQEARQAKAGSFDSSEDVKGVGGPPHHANGDLEAQSDPKLKGSNGGAHGGFASDKDAYQAKENQLDLDYNLPGTASRTATWWSSTYHNTTAMVGAGVLGLPAAFAYLTWSGGVIALVVSWLVTLYTLWQLVVMHEHAGKRFNRYHELAQYAFGPKWGRRILLPPQLIVMVGLGITYTVTGGSALHKIWQLLCRSPCRPFGLSAWIVVFTAIQLFLSQTPNFNSLTVISLTAAVMSIMYSTMAFGLSVHEGRQPGAGYTLDTDTKTDAVLGIFNAIGIVAFAYGGHNVILEIQACMPSPPSTVKPMWRGAFLAYVVVAYCYFTVAISGYYAYGNDLAKKGGDNILIKIGRPTAALVVANIGVVLHVMGSYQVYTMPIFDMIESSMVRHGISNGFVSRLLYRSAYVVLVGFVACLIPFFGDLLGFIGALGMGPATFWYPPWFYLVVKRPSTSSIHFWLSWICIVIGVVITVVGAIGGLYGIIKDASTYTFFS